RHAREVHGTAHRLGDAADEAGDTLREDLDRKRRRFAAGPESRRRRRFLLLATLPEQAQAGPVEELPHILARPAAPLPPGGEHIVDTLVRAHSQSSSSTLKPSCDKQRYSASVCSKTGGLLRTSGAS